MRCRHFIPVILMLGGVAAAGCSYPEVGKPAYEMAIALDQALERRDPGLLRIARETIDRQLRGGAMSEQDHAYLAEIIAAGEQGHWSSARAEVRQLLEDQVQW